jgi:hypothetical protein
MVRGEVYQQLVLLTAYLCAWLQALTPGGECYESVVAKDVL